MMTVDENKRWPALLVAWYDANHRQLPWRETTEAYPIWLSEIMAQQTQIDTVIPYWQRFMAAYPTVEDLAAADIDTVLKLWEGLGYYSRARNLHKAAKVVATEHGGAFPDTFETLQSLPGLGTYTAAAVASIAFDEAVPVVDGNVLRVCARLWGIADDVRQAKVKASMFERLHPEMEGLKPGSFNQGLMELGALICRPRSPRCGECPIAAACVARAEGRTAELPFKSKRPPRPHSERVAAVIWHGERVLVRRRPESGLLGGLWEFPSIERQSAEDAPEQLLTTLLDCEFGLAIAVDHSYCTVRHGYTHFTLALTAYRCELATKGSKAPAGDWRWQTLDELASLAFDKASLKVIDAVGRMSLFQGSGG